MFGHDSCGCELAGVSSNMNGAFKGVEEPFISSNCHLPDAGVAWPSLHCFEKGLLVEDVKVGVHEVSAY